MIWLLLFLAAAPPSVPQPDSGHAIAVVFEAPPAAATPALAEPTPAPRAAPPPPPPRRRPRPRRPPPPPPMSRGQWRRTRHRHPLSRLLRRRRSWRTHLVLRPIESQNPRQRQRPARGPGSHSPF